MEQENQSYSVHEIKTDKDFTETFSTLLKIQDKKIPQRNPEESQIFHYLTRYLRTEAHGIGVKTIICEKEYICLNFLEDYANYYSRTYTDYDKKCKRIHFFSVEFSESDFRKMILDANDKRWNAYKGCIVVKPIPKGLFGVTYLSTYDYSITQNGKGSCANRYYTCLTENKINLFGHEKKIMTMPFKEQDGAVASCASTALWMAFHKTAELFHTKAPSLSEITILAGAGNNSGRIFPSKGLNFTQICTAISVLGMTPELQDDPSHFRCKLHAYLKCGIPVLLGMHHLKGAKKPYNHLVTMNGYRYKENKYQTSISQEECLLLSDTIEMFYVNDDQVGPFARTRIDSTQEGTEIKIITSWGEKNGKTFSDKKFIEAQPAFVVIPLNASIRVPFEDIYIYFLAIRALIELILYINSDKTIHCYDIYLIQSNEYKKSIINKYDHILKKCSKSSRNTIEKRVIDFLSTSFPKYIWVIEVIDENSIPILDFIYDSVESRTNGLPIYNNIFNDKFDKAKQIAQDINSDRKIENSFSCEYETFKNSFLVDYIESGRTNYKTEKLKSDGKNEEKQNSSDKQDFLNNFVLNKRTPEVNQSVEE